ncbi:cation transporter [Candidatus Poribacteria bacterium]|nr:cation transporter [Candidatus Poribacteria bacterium]
MPTDVMRARVRAIRLSVAVGVVMLATKVTAYYLTGSAAIASDAIESVVHVVATVFALYSVVKSTQPPDPLHPYGHGKIEFFSAGFEGGLIILAACAIVAQVARALASGAPPNRLGVGILLTLAAGTVNLVLGVYLVRAGRTTASVTVEADGRHVLTDSYTSLGVVVGLMLVRLTGWSVLDPLVAAAVALNILITGGRLVRQSVGGLMDEAEEDILAAILAVIHTTRAPEWIDIHHLRSWRSGDRRYVDLHLTVPRYWDIDRAHVAHRDVEAAVLEHIEAEGDVIVHMDPCNANCCCFCDVEACDVRSEPRRVDHPWTIERVVGDPAHTEIGGDHPLDDWPRRP